MVWDRTFGAADSERAVQSGDWLFTNYEAAWSSSGNRNRLILRVLLAGAAGVEHIRRNGGAVSGSVWPDPGSCSALGGT
jgi:hypothetical protein